MRRIPSGILPIALFALVAALPVPGLAQGGPSSGGGSTPTNPRPTTPSPSRRSTVDRSRPPIFLTGRVVNEAGRPISDSASVQLNCATRSVQSVHTDLDGYFTINIGTGVQNNFDFSAANDGRQGFAGINSGADLPVRFGDNALAGCELHVSVPHYYPITHTITERTEMGRADMGTIRLTPLSARKDSSVSLAALMVPKDADQEFQKALKELGRNKPEAAMPHLEKAVALYPHFAAAWNQMGQIYLERGLKEKAVTAFEQSTASDPQYIAPLINLASIEMQDRNWEKGIETAQKALAVDSSIGLVSFLVAVGNYNLNNLEAAELSAQTAEKDPNAPLPQVHALLSQIYVQKQDYPQALTHMRTYLEQSPDGPYAEQFKRDIADIEVWLGDGKTGPADAPSKAGS
jgi:predicted negative regulator of RcsB-dependent stress response